MKNYREKILKIKDEREKVKFGIENKKKSPRILMRHVACRSCLKIIFTFHQVKITRR